jgi:hypothetical protein
VKSSGGSLSPAALAGTGNRIVDPDRTLPAAQLIDGALVAK